MRPYLAMILVIGMILVVAGPAAAVEMADVIDHGQAVRGVTNVGTGILELPMNMGETDWTDLTGQSLIKNTYLGIRDSILRVGSGVVDVATFWIPGEDGLAMDPETLFVAEG